MSAAKHQPAQYSAKKIQYGAVCWRIHKDETQVLLITSRDTGRWVIPKGWPMHGKTAFEAAAQEAWEEAGIRGPISEVNIGHFDYDKIMPNKAVPCRILVFSLQATKICKEWPEKRQRKRKWFSTKAAAKKVAEPGLKDLLSSFKAPRKRAKEKQ